MNPNKRIIQKELEHRILHGLACEWEAAHWLLKQDHRRLMRKPLFGLNDLKYSWGYWSREKGEICLSRRLVLNHPWDAVREVLLHEMAHQLAQQGLNGNNEPPHGQSFHKACYLLRANPKASGNYRLLQEKILHGPTDKKDRILVRVKKLMALAQSQNRYEAEAAMVKAHELIAKYNINLFSLETKRDFFSTFVGKPALRHSREAYHLAGLIQDFYFVQGIWVPAYVIEKGKMGRVLEISGTPQNITMASYVYDFVQRFIQSQWNQYNRERGLNRYRKTDFAVGIIEGFRQKLTVKKKKPPRPKKPRSLVPMEDPLLNDYLAYKYPHTTSFRRAVSSQDETVIQDGMRIGKKLVIYKGISEKKTGNSPLIDYNTT